MRQLRYTQVNQSKEVPEEKASKSQYLEINVAYYKK